MLRNGIDVSIYNFTIGTLADKYVEQLTTQPIALISTAIWAKISLATSLLKQFKQVKRMSTSELGRDRPMALEPKRIALVMGNRLWTKTLTLSKEMILWSYNALVCMPRSSTRLSICLETRREYNVYLTSFNFSPSFLPLLLLLLPVCLYSRRKSS